MNRLSLAVAIIIATEVAPTSGIGLAIVLGMFVPSMMSGIIWLLSPKFWRETTTVRFWIVLVVLGLASLSTAKLR